MARPLTGYALTNQFHRLRTRWAFTHLEAYLFFELVGACNDVEWEASFSLTNGLLCANLGCSEKGLIKARKTLADAGLISFVPGQNRKPTVYRFCAAEGLPQVSNSLSKHLPEGLPEVSVSDSKHLPKGLPETLPEVSPYKEQTKRKRKEEKESAADAAAPAASFSENESASPAASSSPTTSQQPRPRSPKKAGATTEQLTALPLPHPGTEFAQLWATFRESPKQVGKALSAFELMLKKLGKYPAGFAIVMLERAIQGGWSGVENPGTAKAFEEWQATQRRQPAPTAAPLPIPDLELNQAFVAQLAAQQAAKQAEHLARYAAAA